MYVQCGNETGVNYRRFCLLFWSLVTRTLCLFLLVKMRGGVGRFETEYTNFLVVSVRHQSGT